MEEFIIKVRSNPCLWDNTSLFFRDNARKHATWEAVATECGMADGKIKYVLFCSVKVRFELTCECSSHTLRVWCV